MARFLKIFVALFLVLQIIFPGWVRIFALEWEKSSTLPYVDGEILVKFKDGYVNMRDEGEMKLLSSQLKSSGKNVREVLADENLVLITNENSALKNALDFVTGTEKKDSVPDLIKLYEKIRMWNMYSRIFCIKKRVM